MVLLKLLLITVSVVGACVLVYHYMSGGARGPQPEDPVKVQQLLSEPDQYGVMCYKGETISAFSCVKVK